MYLPRHFDRSQDKALALRVMREHAFASLISNDDHGFPFVTHLPLVATENDEKIVLLGHVAKPNAHWKYLQARPQALVTFMGPQAYLSPKVYPDLARVPTWNYIAVHCKVQAQLIEEPLAKDRLLKKLIADHEPSYAQQWMDLGTDYQHKMLAGIVGFELQVQSLECKIKLNQHRPEAYEKSLQRYAEGSEQEKSLANWMREIKQTSEN